ncbi:MAG: hypothetical protein HKN95_02060 [Acidimicrobiia bacterium]|nr:hypothetical protein [Acidimicrobiia bacterium]
MDNREKPVRDEKVIGELEEWLRTTRRSAPAGFEDRVRNAIARDRSTTKPSHASSSGSLRTRRTAALASLAIAASVLFLWFQTGEDDSANPTPSIEAASPHLVAHDFLFRAKTASEVCLVGNFNGWAVCNTPLSPLGDGIWSITVELPPGRHEYMFVVDDRWETDPAASFFVDDGFGNRNAVLHLDV